MKGKIEQTKMGSFYINIIYDLRNQITKTKQYIEKKNDKFAKLTC